MKLSQLASCPNLELAWRRITTGGNHQYKRLYRGVYQAYEVALDANLRELRQRPVGGVSIKLAQGPGGLSACARKPLSDMERVIGIEPTTFSLGS